MTTLSLALSKNQQIRFRVGILALTIIPFGTKRSLKNAFSLFLHRHVGCWCRKNDEARFFVLAGNQARLEGFIAWSPACFEIFVASKKYSIKKHANIASATDEMV